MTNSLDCHVWCISGYLWPLCWCLIELVYNLLWSIWAGLDTMQRIARFLCALRDAVPIACLRLYPSLWYAHNVLEGYCLPPARKTDFNQMREKCNLDMDERRMFLHESYSTVSHFHSNYLLDTSISIAQRLWSVLPFKEPLRIETNVPTLAKSIHHSCRVQIKTIPPMPEPSFFRRKVGAELKLQSFEYIVPSALYIKELPKLSTVQDWLHLSKQGLAHVRRRIVM